MFRNILVPIDLEEPSSWERALPVALDLRASMAARVTVMTVVGDTTLAVEAQWSQPALRHLLDTARARLLRIASQADDAEGIEAHVATGNINRAIVDYAREAAIDLVVLAAHRPAMRDRLLGAHAARVARFAPCSVLIVRD